MFTSVMSLIGACAAIVLALVVLYLLVEIITCGMKIANDIYNRMGRMGLIILTSMFALTLLVGWQTTVVSAIVMTVTLCLDQITRTTTPAPTTAAV